MIICRAWVLLTATRKLRSRKAALNRSIAPSKIHKRLFFMAVLPFQIRLTALRLFSESGSYKRRSTITIDASVETKVPCKRRRHNSRRGGAAWRSDHRVALLLSLKPAVVFKFQNKNLAEIQ